MTEGPKYETRLVERAVEPAVPSGRSQDAGHAWSASPLPSSSHPPPVRETQVLCRRRWQYFAAQLQNEPASIAPTMVASTPQPQLTLQLSGALHLTVDKGGRVRQSYRTGAGTLFLTGANQPDVELEWTSLSPAPPRFLHIYLGNDLLEQVATASLGLDVARIELRDGINLDDPLLRELCHVVSCDLEQSESQDDSYGEAVARLLAMQLIRRHARVQVLASTAWRVPLSAKCLHRLGDHVRTHLHEPISLKELAAIAGLSVSHFCTSFKRSTGRTPNQYVIAQRMARATHLLHRTHLTIAHIASLVGYQSASQFSVLFKRHTGSAPGEYARRRSG